MAKKNKENPIGQNGNKIKIALLEYFVEKNSNKVMNLLNNSEVNLRSFCLAKINDFPHEEITGLEKAKKILLKEKSRKIEYNGTNFVSSRSWLICHLSFNNKEFMIIDPAGQEENLNDKPKKEFGDKVKEEERIKKEKSTQEKNTCFLALKELIKNFAETGMVPKQMPQTSNASITHLYKYLRQINDKNFPKKEPIKAILVGTINPLYYFASQGFSTFDALG